MMISSTRVIRALTAVGLTDVSHHTMRHTGVTLMLEHGINPRVIQFLAGWTSLRMLDRDGHVRDSEIRRAVTANAEHVQAVATKTATPEKITASESEN
jgi:site-specific recombinase XerD